MGGNVFSNEGTKLYGTQIDQDGLWHLVELDIPSGSSKIFPGFKGSLQTAGIAALR